MPMETQSAAHSGSFYLDDMGRRERRPKSWSDLVEARIYTNENEMAILTKPSLLASIEFYAISTSHDLVCFSIENIC